MTNERAAAASKGLSIALWIAQILLFVSFAGGGIWKLATPIPDLASKMPWMGQVSPTFLQVTAIFDLLGGIGVLVPSVTRIKPRVTVLAAIGCVLLMASAIVFHISRGEGAKTPFNFFLVALSLFVAWGRWSKAPIEGRA
jgi:uncharacterized membrane protein YphA (DoxX/SURF4 family)